MGQVMPVTVFKYVCEGTIEERIQEIMQQKQQLFDDIVDDVSLDIATRLTDDEIFGLFGLRVPSRVRDERSHPTGLELEGRCAQILTGLGWSVERTARSRDGGIDLVATKLDEVGLEHTILVQCKDHARPVGVETVRELLGAAPPDARAALVLAVPSGVTADACQLAVQRQVRVWDESVLRDLEARAMVR